MVYYLNVRIIETSWGVVPAAASAAGVVALGLPGMAPDVFFRRLGVKYPGFLFIEGDTAVLAETESQLRDYFEGRRPGLDVAFHIRARPFQFRVYETISTIPYGATMTYGEVAAQVGDGNAARAVGRACAANPIPFIVPCHRVVAARGLGGFAGGLALKEKLLAHERYWSSR